MFYTLIKHRFVCRTFADKNDNKMIFEFQKQDDRRRNHNN